MAAITAGIALELTYPESMFPWQAIGATAVGASVGFLGGMFGKGGSAVATPMLSLIGYPGFVAIASPLPATIPGTLTASAAYWKKHWIDWGIVRWSIAIGTPATILGSWLSRYTGSRPLLTLTAVLVLYFGFEFLFHPLEHRLKIGIAGDAGKAAETILPAALPEVPYTAPRPDHWRGRLIAVSLGVGIFSGLLANSGGLLLAPLYARVLKLPLKQAFACSLLVSAVLAVPGTVVHAWLGHISWTVALLVAAGSMPLSYLGAKLALRTRSARLERWYGLALAILGVFFLLHI